MGALCLHISYMGDCGIQRSPVCGREGGKNSKKKKPPRNPKHPAQKTPPPPLFSCRCGEGCDFPLLGVFLLYASLPEGQCEFESSFFMSGRQVA